MGQQIKRHIGQILLDGGFLSNNDIDHALEEQKQTKELLGQVLVRMGVLKARDINAPLLIQDNLSSIDDAVKIAAGERQLLGALLVQSGRITCEQLDRAISEQKKTGEKLGEVFTRLGMLTERQLAALLEFQHNQGEATSGPLRLGELLVETGYISRDQLEDALYKQSLSHKKIGEVLVEEGYVSQNRIKYGFRLQKMLVNSVLAAILSLSMSSTGFASDVSFQWDANTESDLAGYRVYYSPESSPLESAIPLDVGNQTIATISGLDPDQSYKFAVSAYNTSGLESSLSNTITIAEQSPPTVDITSPADSVSVSGAVSISVNASDNVGVTKVEFYVNGVLKSSDIAGPYVYTWDTSLLAPGVYTLMAKAYDAAGNVSQSSRSVTVVNDLIAPTVALTSPANNATLSGNVTISSSASDNIGVTNVEFNCNGVLLYASNVPPYSYTWDTTGVANGNYAIVARAYDNAGNSKQSSTVTVTVNNPVPDLTAPTLSSFTLPATSTSLTVPLTGLTASDNIAVTGYLITESATKPAAGAAGWSAAVPASFTFSAAGTRTAYAWAKDAAVNVSSSRSASVIITLSDVTAPTLNSFTLPAASTSMTVPLTGLAASDNTAVTGFLITESATKPAAGAAGWSAAVPANYTFSAAGTRTAYAWAKDAAGNVSSSRSASVIITLPDVTVPTLSSFTLPATSTSLTVPLTGLAASDNTAVTGYLITESATAPSAGAAGWSAAVPANYTFSSAGTRTAYAWAKDAAGNVSSSRSASVTITLADVTAPTLSSFSLPATADSLTVSLTGLAASDNIGVTGYLITESATAPSAGAAGWSAAIPASYTFSAAGTRTAYAWAKDAAGNVSSSRSAAITITLPDTILPAIAFNSPANGATVSGSVAVTATATDNIGVDRVELYINGVLTKTDSASPFSFTWNTATLANGIYTLQTVAYDTSGNSSASEMTVTVKNSTTLRKKRTGDLNGDGKVDVADALLALRASVGLTAKTVNSQVAAAAADDGLEGDVAPLDASGAPHGDGVIDAADALLILRNAVGMVKW